MSETGAMHIVIIFCMQASATLCVSGLVLFLTGYNFICVLSNYPGAHA